MLPFNDMFATLSETRLKTEAHGTNVFSSVDELLTLHEPAAFFLETRIGLAQVVR